MPIYSYRCSDCGKEFEVVVPMGRRYNVSCDCGAKARKVMDAPWIGIGLMSDRWINRHKKRR